MSVKEVIRWLLGDNTPGVALLTRRKLLDDDPNTRKMKSLRKRCNEYPPAACMIKRTSDALAAGDYAKYRGAYCFISDAADGAACGASSRGR